MEHPPSEDLLQAVLELVLKQVGDSPMKITCLQVVGEFKTNWWEYPWKDA